MRETLEMILAIALVFAAMANGPKLYHAIKIEVVSKIQKGLPPIEPFTEAMKE